MLYAVVHAAVLPLVRLGWRPEVTGLEHVPATGGVLLASNHLAFVDSVVIPCVVPRRVVYLAKDDYFTRDGVRGWLLRWWFEGMGVLPVDRDDGRAAAASLGVAMAVLGRGEAFGIYPEGSRSPDGRLHRGRTGVAHLALTAGVPVVPVGLRGTADLQPRGARLPRLVRTAPLSVAFGPPIEVGDRFAGVPLGRARRQLTDEVMDAIAVLTGQPRAATYNDRDPAG